MKEEKNSDGFRLADLAWNAPYKNISLANGIRKL